MKKFGLKAVVFLIILFFIALIFQKLIDRGLKHSSTDNYKEWSDIVNSNINADAIIQGSSRACFHISPAVLDSALKLNSYNLGLNGWQFHMQYYRFLLYLKYNKKPKYIIQEIDHSSLSKNNNLYQYTQFLPYLNIELIQEAVSTYNGVSWKDIYIPCYKYRGNFELSILGLSCNFQNKQQNKSPKYKGFQEKDLIWNSTYNQFKKTKAHGWRDSLDEGTKTCFKKFLNYCKAENIKIIFVYAPEYLPAQKLLLNRDSITTILRTYAVTYNFPFLDYSNDSICLDTINFYNSRHLNSIGVRKFNLKLVHDLKKIIK